jgi:hypothetical protein
MRLPSCYLPVGIGLTVLIIFLLVTPLVDPTWNAFPTTGLPGAQPSVVLVRYAEYTDYGPRFILSSDGTLIRGRLNEGTPDYRVSVLSPGEHRQLLSLLDLERLTRLSRRYTRARWSHAPTTVLLFWLGGRPYTICVDGDPGPEADSTVVPAFLDSVFRALEEYTPPASRPWRPTDSTVVFHAWAANQGVREWPSSFPAPPSAPGGMHFVPVTPELVPSVSFFIRSLLDGEVVRVHRRTWHVSLRPRFPGEPAWQW